MIRRRAASVSDWLLDHETKRAVTHTKPTDLESCQKEIVVDDGLAVLELVLGAIKVIVHEEVLQELRDGV